MFSFLRDENRVIRYTLFCIFVTVLLTVPFIVHAQQTEPVPTVTIQELEDLAAVLDDDAARGLLQSRINALIATMGEPQPEPLAERTGDRLISVLSENMRETSRQLVTAANVLSHVPAFLTSVLDQATNPDARQRWFNFVFKVILIIVAGVVAELLARRMLGRPKRSLEEQDVDTLWVRLLLLAGRTVLDLVPLAVFAAGAYGATSLLQPTPEAHVMALTLINAYLIVRVIAERL